MLLSTGGTFLKGLWGFRPSNALFFSANVNITDFAAVCSPLRRFALISARWRHRLPGELHNFHNSQILKAKFRAGPVLKPNCNVALARRSRSENAIEEMCIAFAFYVSTSCAAFICEIKL